jgi:hypothetical protein
MQTPHEPVHFKLVTKADAAQVFSVCTKTIDNYIKSGLIPPPVPFGAKEYWHPEVFQAHLDRVFRRSLIDVESEEQKPEAGEKPPPSMTVGLRDSSPSIRQQARQAAKLKLLNS